MKPAEGASTGGRSASGGNVFSVGEGSSPCCGFVGSVGAVMSGGSVRRWVSGQARLSRHSSLQNLSLEPEPVASSRRPLGSFGETSRRDTGRLRFGSFGETRRCYRLPWLR